jgi:hypothetical protein
VVIIDVPQGTFYGYTPDAINGFTNVPLLTTESGADDPRLDQANTIDSAGAARANLVLANGSTLALDYARGIDAVSAILMKQSIANDYLADATLGGATDWVITLPTRAYYVDQQLHPTAIVAPFVEAAHGGESRVIFDQVAYDRESGFSTVHGCVNPPGPNCVPQLTIFRRASNVIAFLDPWEPNPERSGVLDSALPYSIPDIDGRSGFARIDLATGDGGHVLGGGKDSDGTPFDLAGLPAIGFMAYNIVNTQAAPGLLANYGGAFAHRATVACTGDEVHCP